MHKRLKTAFQPGIIENDHKNPVGRAMDQLAVVCEYVEARGGHRTALWNVSSHLLDNKRVVNRLIIGGSISSLTSTKSDMH